MASGELARDETKRGRASSESVVRLRRDPEGWLRSAWEEGTHPVLAAGLSTLSFGYRAALLVRGLSYDWRLLATRRLPCPVVSLGNLTVGGSGKTPLVELAALTLVALGAAPAVVSRGYGRSTRGVYVVADRQSVRLGARGAGDEPLLLAERLPGIPVVVGENRFEAGRHAVETLGASVVVLDDGFQNRTIAKSLEILVVSARSPWGNGRLFPSGRLREPLSALQRAQLVVVTNPRGDEDVEAVTRTLRLHDSPAPVASARYEPVEARRVGDGARLPLADLARRRLLAFGGLAAPRSFMETAEGLGILLAGFIEFGDHHWYTDGDLEEVARRAALAGAEGLITTEKDAMRLRDLALPRLPLWILSVRMVIATGQAAWVNALRQVAAPARTGAQ
jgi:tetraacyldisaccharide 4'-kinase